MTQPVIGIEVVAQTSPNPQAIRLVCTVQLLEEGAVRYVRGQPVPAHALFQLAFAHPAVAEVYVVGHSMGLVKDDPETDWYEVLTVLRPALVQLLQAGMPPLVPNFAPMPAGLPAQLAEWFKSRILPATEQDGGGIYLLAADEGCLTVQAVGACRTCPHIQTTIQQGILQPLQQAGLPYTQVRVAGA